VQKLIIADSRVSFDIAVNGWLKDGWKVVPKTLKIIINEKSHVMAVVVLEKGN
jgi:hypothetical protein